MSFYTIIGDVTKTPCDVVINSVGVSTKIYGGICKAVLAASNSPELKQIIDRANDVYYVGESFITDGYGLPCDKILHVITPNFENDKDYSLFKECIRRLLNECKLNGLYNIAIPAIGAGANGYNGEKVEDIIREMCEAYVYYYPEMSITFVLADKKTSDNNHERIVRESFSPRSPHDPETLKKFKKGSKLMNVTTPNASEYSLKYFNYDGYTADRELDVDTDGIGDIDDYVERYIDARIELDQLYDDEDSHEVNHKRINIYFGYGKKGNDTYNHSGADAYNNIRYNKYADKKHFFKLIFALRMNMKEAKDFLNFFGHSFANPSINPVDAAVIYLIEHHRYGIVEIESEFKKRKILKQSIFKK